MEGSDNNGASSSRLEKPAATPGTAQNKFSKNNGHHGMPEGDTHVAKLDIKSQDVIEGNGAAESTDFPAGETRTVGGDQKVEEDTRIQLSSSDPTDKFRPSPLHPPPETKSIGGTPQQEQSPSTTSITPSARGHKHSILREKRSWSVSNLAIAVSKSVSSMTKKFFRDSSAEPDIKADEQEAEEVARKNEWTKLLSKNYSHAKLVGWRHVNRLCWKGIPSSIRGKAWKAIIGDELKITPELFGINLKRGQKLWEEQVTSKKVMPLDREDEMSREDSMRIIQADIPRTFPQLKFFHPEGPMHEPLLQILQAYVCYRPDVGYVQGMSYLAAILLLNMPTYDSFLCLANLLNKDIYFAFFRMDVDKMKTHLRVYQALFKEKLPVLYKHFETVELKPGMYLYEWLLTIYSRSLPIDLAHRIWDNFLYHGQVFLFRTALGMLRLFESKFLKMGFEGCLSMLNRPPEDIRGGDLFDNIYRIQLTSKRFDKMVAKFMEEEKRNTNKKINGPLNGLA